MDFAKVTYFPEFMLIKPGTGFLLGFPQPDDIICKGKGPGTCYSAPYVSRLNTGNLGSGTELISIC